VKKSTVVLVLFFNILMLPRLGFAQEPAAPPRDLLFELGLGPWFRSFPPFGPTVNSQLSVDPLFSSYVHMALQVGFGVTLADSLYMILRYNQLEAYVEDSETVIASLASGDLILRHYPFSIGLFVDLGGRLSALSYHSAGIGTGLGVVGSLGYDFMPRRLRRMVSVALLGSFRIAYVELQPVYAASMYVDVLFRGNPHGFYRY